MGLFNPNTRGLSGMELAVMNVMVDQQFVVDIAEAAELEQAQARGAIERLQKRGLVMRMRPGGSRWALTHAGKRAVR